MTRVYLQNKKYKQFRGELLNNIGKELHELISKLGDIIFADYI